MIIHTLTQHGRPPTCNDVRVCMHACVPLFYCTQIRCTHRISRIGNFGHSIWYDWNANAKYEARKFRVSMHNAYTSFDSKLQCYTPVQLNFHAHRRAFVYVCMFVHVHVLFVSFRPTHAISTIIYPFARFLEYVLYTEFDRMAEFTEPVLVREFSSQWLCRLFVRVALLCITLNISLHS